MPATKGTPEKSRDAFTAETFEKTGKPTPVLEFLEQSMGARNRVRVIVLARQAT
jgi:hypothetical protein